MTGESILSTVDQHPLFNAISHELLSETLVLEL